MWKIFIKKSINVFYWTVITNIKTWGTSACHARAVSGYFGNGARAFEIGKNSVVLDKIGKIFNKLKKKSVLSFAIRDVSWKWTWWAIAHQVQKKKWAGGMGAAYGPHWVQGNALVGPGRGSEKIWVFKHLNGNFLLNPDTYFSQKMARNTLRKILEFFFLM